MGELGSKNLGGRERDLSLSLTAWATPYINTTYVVIVGWQQQQ